MQPITRETVVERRQTHLRWSAIFAGAVFAIGVWILLETLGAGLGLATIDTDDAGNLRSIGIGTGIWSLVAPLIAIFCGGLVVGRMAGARNRVGAMIHGAVMWALVTLVGLWAVVTIVSTLATGAVRIGGAVASATSSAVSKTASAVDPARVMAALGVRSTDLLAPVNARLQRQGKPAITTGQLGAALRGIAQRGIREGRLDHEIVVEEVAQNTSLSQADANDVANQLDARFDQLSTDLQNRVSEAGEHARSAALEAASGTGKGLFYSGIMLLLALVAGAGGAAAAGRRDILRSTTTTTYPPAHPPEPVPTVPTSPPPPSSPAR